MTIGREPSMRQLVNFVASYIGENGWPPSRRDIAARFHISVSTAQFDVERAVEAGFLKIPPSPPGKVRALAVTPEGMRLLHPSVR